MKELTKEHTDNIVELYNNLINNLDDVLELCKNTPSKIKIKNKNNSVDVDNENLSTNDLCNLIKTSEEWTSWSIEVVDKATAIPTMLIDFITSVTGESAEFINQLIELGIDELTKWIMLKLEELFSGDNKKIKKICKKIIAKVKIALTTIKIAILNGQIFVYKNIKKVLESINCERVNSSLNTILPGILQALQSCATVILTGLTVINTIMNMLGTTMMSIDGGTMSFFMTPKTLLMGLTHFNMKPFEPNNDLVGSSIINMIDPILNEMTNKMKEANEIIKISYITNNVALYQATQELPDFDEVLLNFIDVESIREKIKTLLLTLSVSEPMPKYENLKITNIRFLMWLNTVFVPAMKTCFGIPGMP